MFAAVFGVAVLLYNSKENTVLYEKFLWYIGTPFLVLVPVVLAIIRCAGQRKKHLRSGAVICVLLGLMGLSGCATAELEERNFPIEMAVSDMEQFDREWLNADESGNRMVDYSHMKVILLDQKFLEDAQNMDAFLEILEKKSDVPRNTYLAVAEDAEAVLKLQKNMEESVGTYLEDYLKMCPRSKKLPIRHSGCFIRSRKTKWKPCLSPMWKKWTKSLP